jgi:hypothetical protein
MRVGRTLASLMVVVLGVGAVGCETHTGNAALLGGAGGSLVGAAIGSQSHGRAGEGALLGGAIGAVGGAIVGNEMDRQERGAYYGYDGGGRSYEEEPYYEAYEPAPRYRTSVHYYRVETHRPRYVYRDYPHHQYRHHDYHSYRRGRH